MRLSAFHPVSSLIYFAAVLIATMFSFSPAIQICSVVGALLELFMLESKREFFRNLRFTVVVWLAVAVTNPLFSHKGVTPLFFINGRAFTLEALLYGVMLGGSLSAVIMWFKVFGKVFDRERLLYIFGRKTPKLALIITMTRGFVPKLKAQYRRICDGRKCSGTYMSESRIERLKASCGIFTALCSSALESAVQTGMSMKARGFGTGKRSFAHSFKFRFGDGVFLFVCILLFSAAMIYSGTGKLRADFYPRVAVSSEPLPILCFAVLCAIPFILEVKESLKWKFCLAKI